MPRIYCPTPLTSGQAIELPAGAARHVQVLRLQPGDSVTLFDGTAGEYEATITHMGRSAVSVQVGTHAAVEREAGREIHLALGIPANERMDWLVEKATELGVSSIQPLLTERSVLRVSGERAEKKREHWQAIAVAACEQCGRNRVPALHPIATLKDWLRTAPASSQRLLLSLRPETRPLHEVAASGPLLFLSGPEGGLSAAEEEAALSAGFTPVTLGARTLRAETAPLAALAALTLGTCP